MTVGAGFVRWCATVLATSAAVLGTVAVPAVPASAAGPVEHVVIVGAAGLRWSDLSLDRTPTLWRMAGSSAVGSMVVRSAQEYTCPADGWLTVGAGNRVRVTNGRTEADCGARLPRVVPGPGSGAVVPDQRYVLEDNENLTYRARPGVLAELVDCSVAVGHGAAIAAARPGVGRVDRYVATLPADPGPLLRSCPVSIVDAGTVRDGESGGEPGASAVPGSGTVPDGKRRAAAARVDATVARILRHRPDRSLVMVAGISDVTGPSHLHVAMLDGPGFPTGVLRSWRTGYARLIDLAPTASHALGEPRSKWFAGAPMQVSREHVAAAERVSRLVDADRAASVQPGLADRFAVLLVLLQLMLYLAVVPVLWRIRRAAVTEVGDRPVWTYADRILEVCAVAAGLLLPAAMLADLVPWWRFDAPGLTFGGVTLAVLAVLTAAIRFAPWWRTPLGPVASVAAVAVAVVGGDLLTGGRLQLDGVAGYAAVAGGRFAGLSAIGAGVFAVGVLLLAGVLGQRVPRPRAPATVAVVGAVGVVLAGVVGMDPGSAIALTAGVCLSAITCTGGWLTANRLLGATFVGLGIAGVFVLLNLYPQPEHRGRLGRYFTDIAEGVPGALIHRTAEANAVTFASSPLTILVLAGALFAGLVLLRPSGGLLRVYGLYPEIRAALIGSVVTAVLGGLVDGAGVVVAGAATATALPLAILLCLRVLARAHLRTARPLPSVPPGPAQPAADP